MNRYAIFTFVGLLLAGLSSTAEAQTFTRKPFLQKAMPTGGSVCWRLSSATSLTVRYGTDSTNLNLTSAASSSATDNCADLTGLSASTRYYYKVYNGVTLIPGSAQQYFVTQPPANSKAKHTFWIIGDFGTGDANAQSVRNGFVTANGGNHVNGGILMLGDNAYSQGSDAQFTSQLFNIYPDILATSFAWPVIGNHEAMTSSGGPYLSAFYLPTAGQSGGVASGTEYYYSFDYGNIHFIGLDSEVSNRSIGGAQYLWLEQDLQNTDKDWIVVMFHTPPYTRGSHNSETEPNHLTMRLNFMPLLESYGVDLVLSGHSHSYERSFLLDSGYTTAATNSEALRVAWFASNRSRIILDSSSGDPGGTGPYHKEHGGNNGTIYNVVGTSGQVSGTTGVMHPTSYTRQLTLGSSILDVEDSVMTVRFIGTNGAVLDKYQIVKRAEIPPLPLPTAPQLVAPVAAAQGVSVSPTLSWSAVTDAATYRVQLASDPAFVTLLVNDSSVTGTSRPVGPLANNTVYFWRVNAKNPSGTSAYSGTLAFTTVIAAPQLVSPAPETPGVSASPTLSWNAVTDAATYRVQLASDPAFATLLVDDSSVTGTSRPVGPLANNTVHFWRVNAKNAFGTSAYSVTGAFTTVIATPQLVSPAGAAQGVSLSPTLSWNAVAGAATYGVQLASDSAFVALLVDDSSVVGGARPVGPLANNTLYFWKVNAKNVFGTSAYSGMRAFTTVVAAPLITASPRDTTVVASGSASFTVGATGPGLTYQWRKGTVNASAGTGATTDTYRLTGVALADTAADYNVIVASSGSGTDSALSANARLYVNVAPGIVTQPATQGFVLGGTASFSVVAATGPGSSAGVLSYQWRKGSLDLANVDSISGATGAALTISGMALKDTGSYSVVITRTLNGTVTTTVSNTARLDPPVAILPGSLVFRVTGSTRAYAFVLPAGVEGVERMTVRIRDILGHTLWTKSVRPSADPKSREVVWNGFTSSGARVSAGIYVMRVEMQDAAGTKTISRKSVLLDPL